jgi:hypothetical protein
MTATARGDHQPILIRPGAAAQRHHADCFGSASTQMGHQTRDRSTTLPEVECPAHRPTSAADSAGHPRWVGHQLLLRLGIIVIQGSPAGLNPRSISTSPSTGSRRSEGSSANLAMFHVKHDSNRPPTLSSPAGAGVRADESIKTGASPTICGRWPSPTKTRRSRPSFPHSYPIHGIRQ